MKTPRSNIEYIRSTIFGIEDSLVSTTGLLAGLSVGGSDKSIVVFAGLVAIIVEAVSMGASEYISTDAMGEMDKLKRHSEKPALISAILMLGSYIVAGFMPLIPYFFMDGSGALVVSIVLALFGLFVLGYTKGKLARINPFVSAGKVLFVGGLATFIGIVAGRVFII